MGIEELEKLVSESLQLGLQGPELRAWVECERAKRRAQREAERAALKAAQERETAELKSELAQLQRQLVECSGEQLSQTTLNGGVHCKRDGKEGLDGLLVPVRLKTKGVFPKLECHEEKLGNYAGTLLCEPHIALSKQDTLLSQDILESTEAEGLDVSETDSSLLSLALECEESSKRECLERQYIRAQEEPGLPAEFRKLRKRRRRRKERGMSSTKLTIKLPSDSAQKGNQKCLKIKLRFCDHSGRMQSTLKRVWRSCARLAPQSQRQSVWQDRQASRVVKHNFPGIQFAVTISAHEGNTEKNKPLLHTDIFANWEVTIESWNDPDVTSVADAARVYMASHVGSTGENKTTQRPDGKQWHKDWHEILTGIRTRFTSF